MEVTIKDIISSSDFGVPAVGGGYLYTYSRRIRQELLKAHPKQFIASRTDLFNVKPYWVKVRYSYLTARGNSKKGEKYLTLSSFDDEMDEYGETYMNVESILTDWVENMAQRNPHKAISNVRILGIDFVGYQVLHVQS